jgi:hypothetical protein
LTLWALAGSWSGALILVGFDPLNEDQRRVMAKHYALAHASPDLLPAEIRRTLPPSCQRQIIDTFINSIRIYDDKIRD